MQRYNGNEFMRRIILVSPRGVSYTSNVEHIALVTFRAGESCHRPSSTILENAFLSSISGVGAHVQYLVVISDHGVRTCLKVSPLIEIGQFRTVCGCLRHYKPGLARQNVPYDLLSFLFLNQSTNVSVSVPISRSISYQCLSVPLYLSHTQWNSAHPKRPMYLTSFR